MPAVLFVCTANRIRSPLAAALFQRRLAAGEDAATWRVASAGTWADDGLPAMAAAQQVAAEAGLDLSRHRSRRVEELDLADFDLILTMTTGQAEALRVEMPGHAARILPLTQAALGLAYDVDDPVGRPVAIYRRTLDELDDIMARGLAQIVARAEANAEAAATEQAEG